MVMGFLFLMMVNVLSVYDKIAEHLYRKRPRVKGLFALLKKTTSPLNLMGFLIKMKILFF